MSAYLMLWHKFEEESGIKPRHNDCSLTPRQRHHEGHHHCVDVIEWQQTQLNDAFPLRIQQWRTVHSTSNARFLATIF